MSHNMQPLDMSFFKFLVEEPSAGTRARLTEYFDQLGPQYTLVADADGVIATLMETRYDLLLTNDGAMEARLRHSEESFRKLLVLPLGKADPQELTARLRETTAKIYDSLAVLDEESLDKIRMFDDEEQSLLKSLLDIYTENTREELRQMEELIAAGNLPELRKKAHKLKSSSAQLGAWRFEKYCHLMEYDTALNVERARKFFTEMKQEYEISLNKFRLYCQNHGR
jgi:HPt (histidine-containing phosphotransfer) domain-containing protein